MAVKQKKIDREIRREFDDEGHLGPVHLTAEVVHEHGQCFMNCKGCGAQWAVAESNGGYVFEQISDGDESCLFDYPGDPEQMQDDWDAAQMAGEE